MTTTQTQWDDKRYHSLNYELKHRYGEKVYRLSINGGMTCPNRDGTLDNRGCIFCSAGGSGDFATSPALSISAQIEAAKGRIAAKTSCSQFIAYFQAYTNTYAPVDYLRSIFTEALSHPQVVALSIATRPDCIDDEVLTLLAELNAIKPVWVELGLQTIHPKTSTLIRSGFTYEGYLSAVNRLHGAGLEVITHLILGLPGETPDMMLQSVRAIASLPVSGVKLQLLHVLAGTDLADYYQTNPFPVFTMEEYCELIVRCLELLPPEMVIHRITGDGPRALLLAPLWITDKKRTLNTIHKLMQERDTWQGRLYTSCADA